MPFHILTDQVMLAVALILLGVYLGCFTLLMRLRDSAILWLLAPIFAQSLFVYYYYITVQENLVVSRTTLVQTILLPALLVLWLFVGFHIVARVYAIYQRHGLTKHGPNSTTE